MQFTQFRCYISIDGTLELELLHNNVENKNCWKKKTMQYVYVRNQYNDISR